LIPRKDDELQNGLRDAEEKREIQNLNTPQQLFEKPSTRAYYLSIDNGPITSLDPAAIEAVIFVNETPHE
jgi:hypothetical protein